MQSFRIKTLLTKVTALSSTLLVAFTLSSPLLAQQPTALEVLEKMEEFERASNDSSFSRMQLSSCKFGVREGKITCAERARVKALESVGKSVGLNLKDTKSISLVLEPAAERGIGMLSFAYDDATRDNETWLYLSALGRVKRIAGGSEEDTEPASMFGSEFTTEDMDTGKLEEYTHTMLGEDVEGGREVWKIESVPSEKRARTSRYAKTIQYIDKERYVALRVEMYDRFDKEVKRLLASRVEFINDVWLARSLTIMNLVTNRLSNMAILEINPGIDVNEEFLTQRTLTDVAFREAELAKIRAQVQ